MLCQQHSIPGLSHGKSDGFCFSSVKEDHAVAGNEAGIVNSILGPILVLKSAEPDGAGKICMVASPIKEPCHSVAARYLPTSHHQSKNLVSPCRLRVLRNRVCDKSK